MTGIKILKRILLVGFGVFIALPVFAEDLAEIYDLAHAHDAKWRGANATRTITAESERQALGRLLPSLVAEGSYSHSLRLLNEQEVTAKGTGFVDIPLRNEQHLHEGSWDVSLSQTLYNPADWFALQSGRYATQQADAQLAWEEQELMVRVVERYVDVLRAADALRSSRMEELAYLEQGKQAAGRLKGGVGSITDVDQAEAAYQASIAQRITDAGNVKTALAALGVLTGLEHSSVSLLMKQFPVTSPDPEDMEAWVDSAKSGNYQVKAATQAVHAADSNISAKTAGYSPRITGSLVYQEDQVSGDQVIAPYSPFATPPNMTNHTRMAVIKATMPFDINGTIGSERRQARAQYELSREQKEDIMRNVMQETRKRWISASSDVQQVRARQLALAAAQRAVVAMRSGYKHGIHSMVDVLQAERQAFIAERELAHARYDYIVDTIHLKELTGQLSPQDLVELNDWMEEPGDGLFAGDQ